MKCFFILVIALITSCSKSSPEKLLSKQSWHSGSETLIFTPDNTGMMSSAEIIWQLQDANTSMVIQPVHGVSFRWEIKKLDSDSLVVADAEGKILRYHS